MAIGWVLAAGAAVGAFAASGSADRPGMLLFGLGAVAMASAAAYGTFVRPRLAADAAGVRIRSLGGTRRLAWREVGIRLTTVRRLGRDAAALEIEPVAAAPHTAVSGADGDEGVHSGLVVLGWLELGADPRDVHDDLTALQARHAGPGSDRATGD
ncbi:PH domain-containing protein [Prauserella alba]|uniref:PH domain-containing protein n=1 Tax=Prauserella alba TaxID=176898 RepID=UPI0020A4F52B|nr:PH domain-containing protein [Prauserella alba]